MAIKEKNEKEKIKKEKYIIKIGPLLKKLLDDQMASIKETTYGVCDSSYWEAGEIIAKKYRSG